MKPKEKKKEKQSYKLNDGVYEVITFFKKLSSGGSVKEKKNKAEYGNL